MLILTRKVGESLIIRTSTGEEIEVIVVGTKGKQIQLGTEAADDVSVFREEVLQRIREAS